MKPRAAFMFLSPGADSKKHRTIVETDTQALMVVAVKTYDDAVATAKELADEGLKIIELCGGFGNEGTALVSKAVEGRMFVGVVKFDIHPGLEYKTGDVLFQ